MSREQAAGEQQETTVRCDVAGLCAGTWLVCLFGEAGMKAESHVVERLDCHIHNSKGTGLLLSIRCFSTRALCVSYGRPVAENGANTAGCRYKPSHHPAWNSMCHSARRDWQVVLLCLLLSVLALHVLANGAPVPWPPTRPRLSVCINQFGLVNE